MTDHGYGHEVIGVFPTEDTPEEERYQFAYTVGRDTELLMTGRLPLEAMAGIINHVTEFEDSTGPLEPGQFLKSILSGGYELGVVEVRDMDKAQMFQSTGSRAFQLVWPDSDGNFPWHEGYAYEPDVQPLFNS